MLPCILWSGFSVEICASIGVAFAAHPHSTFQGSNHTLTHTHTMYTDIIMRHTITLTHTPHAHTHHTPTHTPHAHTIHRHYHARAVTVCRLDTRITSLTPHSGCFRNTFMARFLGERLSVTCYRSQDLKQYRACVHT